MFKILIGVVVAAFVVIIGFLVIDPDLNKSNNNNSITEVVTDGYRYTIEGEVNKAGTYVLSDNITMADLISAAGVLLTILLVSMMKPISVPKQKSIRSTSTKTMPQL